MPTKAASKGDIAQQLSQHLREVSRLREAARSDAKADAIRHALRSWQSQRLSRTYPDLLESARFGDAARFFQNDLYGPKDFSQRDAEVERIVPTLTRLMPAPALAVIARAIELDALSEKLDASLASRLKSADIDDERYARAYRSEADRPDRERQIALIGEIGATLNKLVRLPLLGATLLMMRGPANMAGLGDLHDFLQRGFEAFKKMGDARTFVDAVTGRETAFMERLYAKEADPFRLDGLA